MLLLIIFPMDRTLWGVYEKEKENKKLRQPEMFLNQSTELVLLELPSNLLIEKRITK